MNRVSPVSSQTGNLNAGPGRSLTPDKIALVRDTHRVASCPGYRFPVHRKSVGGYCGNGHSGRHSRDFTVAPLTVVLVPVVTVDGVDGGSRMIWRLPIGGEPYSAIAALMIWPVLS